MKKSGAEVQKQLAAIGARIRRLRKERGYSQESFALHAGLPRAYMGQVERGERNLSVANLTKIALGLQAEVGELFPPLTDLAASHVSESKAALAISSADTTDAISTLTNTDAGPAEIVRHQLGSPEDAQGAEGEECFLSTGAVAEQLGVSSRTLERWAESRAIPASFVQDKAGKRSAIFRGQDLPKIIEARDRAWVRRSKQPKSNGKG